MRFAVNVLAQRRAWRVALAASAAALAAVGAAHAQRSARAVHPAQAGREPAELHGAPLGSATGLHLVVANGQPFVLDVDSGAMTRLRGLEAAKRGVVVVQGVSERSAVVSSQRLLPGGTSGPRYARAVQVYAVESGRTTTSHLGAGSLSVVPTASGLGVWATRRINRSACELRRLELDGTPGMARAIPCSWTVSAGGSLGLVVNRTRIVDPSTGRTILRTHLGVLAATGRHLLLGGPGTDELSHSRLALLDASTGVQMPLRWPSALAQLDEPAADPEGRYIAIGFGDPAWKQGSEQVLDVWVVDTMTGALTHVPGMPAFVLLKFTSMQWTHDGRLVLLGRDSDTRAFVAVWRPRQPRLRVKTLQLPEPSGGSDSFAVIR
jgi:hypothetical protein